MLTVSLVAWGARVKRPWFALGWFWYLVMLLPVLGLVQYSSAPYADRYMYLPGMGLSLAAVGLFCGADGKRPGNGRGTGTALVVLVLILALAGLSWRQTGFWRSTRAAFTRVIRLHPGDDLAHAKLGDCDFEGGDLAGATAHYTEALRIRPDFADWNYNFGSMLLDGHPERALPLLEKAAAKAPNRGDIQTNLGYALLLLKQPDAALPHLEEGARLDPENPGAHVNLGVALLRLGRKEDARAAFQRALVLDPENAAAKANLALVQ